MDQKALITMLAIGLVAGWLASFVIPGARFGIISYLVCGVLGSFVGGPLLNALGVNLGIKDELGAKFVTSTIGAIAVSIVAKLIG